MDKKNFGLNTKLLHEGGIKDELAGAHISPIYQTSTYVFDDVETAIYLNQHQDKGFTYSRFGNPSVAELEEKIAILEHSEAALAVGSGMAAITTALMTTLVSGDHLIAPNVIYGCTFAFLEKVINNYGVEVTLIDTNDLKEIEAAVKENTVAIYIETPANPLLKITDIAAVSEIAKKNHLKLIVDSTFASPALQNPITLGADVVVHSATKYLCGHGTIVGGVIASTKEFIDRARFPYLQTFGAVLSPFEAWQLMQGIKTLGIRMERQCANAMELATYLESHPMVERVYYPGLESHPTHEIAKKQMKAFGGMMSVDIKGGMDSAIIFMENVKIFSLATSLGNIDSLIQHSPTMSHFDMTEEERNKVGIYDGQVRMSVGIENIEDLIQDVEAALKVVEANL